MKKYILFVFAVALTSFTACNNNSKSSKSAPLAVVLNTDTINLSCDADNPISLIFLGDPGKYVRVTVNMNSTISELMIDTSAIGQRFTASDKSLTLLVNQGNYSFYKDTQFLFSCFSGQIGREFKTTTGVVYVVEETHPNGVSLSNIRITSRGMAEVETDFSLTDNDPVKDIFLADLNKDGFEELYLITEVAGTGGYGGIIGLASNNDKSTSTITVPELTEDDMKADKLFEGYRGRDKIYIENAQLVREFPVFNPADRNARPSGGKRKLVYSLSKGEASWILTPKLSQEEE